MWRRANINPLGKRTGDCVVRACAHALGVTWDEVYEGLCRKGYEIAEMPSWNATWWAYLRDRGFSRHVIPDSCPDCYAVADFARDHPIGRHVLYIPNSTEGAGHAVAVVRGDWIDTWDSGRESPLAYWRKDE